MIHGLTPQFTECGKIKLGGLGDERKSKSGGTYRMPEKYDHFELTKTFRNAEGDLAPDIELMKAVAAITGDDTKKLRAIPIVLHSDDIDEVFPSMYARYVGKKLHCSGDGKVALRWELKKDAEGHMIRTGEKKQLDCPCPFLQDKTCKPHGTLHCSIRVPGLAVAGAIHTLRTTSIITIKRIIGSLMQVKKTVGMIQGLPLWLVVQPVVTEKGTVYCAHVELRAEEIMSAQRNALESAKMRGALIGEVVELNKSYRAMLQVPANEAENEEEQAAVAAEFHPSPSNSAVEVVDEKTGEVTKKTGAVDALKGKLGVGKTEPKPKDPPGSSGKPATQPEKYDYGPPPLTDAEIEQMREPGEDG